MKTQKRFKLTDIVRNCFIAIIISIPGVTVATNMQNTEKPDSENYTEYKGIVVDQKKGSAIEFADLTIDGTTISVVTNMEGEFTLKVPKDLSRAKLIVSYIGYKNKTVSISGLRPKMSRIELVQNPVELREVTVTSMDAETLVRDVMYRKGDNYLDEKTFMKAFYREAIKKDQNCVCISEALVDICKQPYTSYKSDAVKIYKARKKTDFKQSDAIAFKLRGGPYNSLYLDVMKNPEKIFMDDLSNYTFTYEGTTLMDNKLIYIVNFKQRPYISDPLYCGKLYIDAENLALKTAIFKLNVENKELAGRMFFTKKPLNCRVYPLEASYRIDYRQKDGKWYYGYSRIDLDFRVKWNKKQVDTNIHSTIEMAVIDWDRNNANKTISRREQLKPSAVLADRVTGFTDSDFWGEYNVIEPEKSIESAIEKLKKNLDENKNESEYVVDDMGSE